METECIRNNSVQQKIIDPFNKEELHQAMEAWKAKCEQRRIDIVRPFKQFDK